MISARQLHTAFDPATGRADGLPTVERRLSDLRGCFMDEDAYATRLAGARDPLVYTVSTFEPEPADGALHYGIGRLEAGRVGDEYFMTKGHFHAWRSAAELYVGLRGRGLMLLEDGESGESRAVPLGAHQTVYVPGGTAHRTINVGDEPLVYLGIYPAGAGHDYGAIAERNFRKVVVAGADGPAVLDRHDATPDPMPGRHTP